MTSPRVFSISDQSTVLRPGLDEIDVLRHGLQQCHSIFARQSRQTPIRSEECSEQFLYCETAGTSGAAKMIRRRPESWIRSFEVNRDIYALGPGDTYATFGQPGHSLCLYALIEAFHVGADVLPLHGISPKNQVTALISQRASILYATPSQLGLLGKAATALDVAAIPDVRRIFAGGGKLDTTLHNQLAGLFPMADIHEFFGAGETSFISITDSGTPADSVGRPYPGVSLRIETDGRPAPLETGEIWIKSPYLFDGYEGTNPPDTRWRSGQLSIGEMGYLDDNGYLFLKGRKNRMVTVADMNVFPEEIEKTLVSLPEVPRCVVVPQPDQKRGHRIICVIEAVADEGLTKRLRRKCREELGAHTVPYRFIFMDKIPLLAAGKPDIQALKQQLEATG